MPGTNTPTGDRDPRRGTARKRRGWIPFASPLRYPGAKRKLATLIADTIDENTLKPKLFVEPFAGSAAVALRLLANGVVEKIGLAELDPLVASFWKAIFWDTEWLVQQVWSVPVTIESWRILKASRPRSTRELALKCLFLNRTSFSGMLTPDAGPIGGYEQASDYPIDCRFPRETLARRIEMVGNMRDSVEFVRCGTWQQTIEYVRGLRYVSRDVFLYMDPPFYKKASRLYNYYFTTPEHRELCRALAGLDYPWFLSYDPARQITQMYRNNGTKPAHVEVLYSAATGSSLRAVREVVMTNQNVLPVGRHFMTYARWKRTSASQEHEQELRRDRVSGSKEE